jgi:hypothetical protein
VLSRSRSKRGRLLALTLPAVLAAQAAVAAGPFRVRIEALPPGYAPSVVALTTTSCLVLLSGYSFVDDVYLGSALLVEDLDGEPTTTPLPLPEGVRPIGDEVGIGTTSVVRLSATRVVVAHSGPDGMSGTGDEGVLLLDDLGGSNGVQAIPVGPMFSPNVLALDERSVAVQTDGGVSLVSDLGGANLVTPIEGVWWPELAVSRTGFIALGESGAVHVKVGEGAPQILPLPAGPWEDAVRLAEDRLLLTEADGLRFVPDVNEPDQSTLIPVPGLAYVARTGPNRAIGRSLDVVVLVDDLGGRNRVKTVRVPGMSSYGGAVSLGRRSAVVRLGDAFGDFGFAWIRPGAPPLRVPLPTQSQPIALSPTRFVIAGDSDAGGEADELMHAYKLDDPPRARTIEVPYAQTLSREPWALLGNGRAIQAAYLQTDPLTPFFAILDGMPGGMMLDDVVLDVAGADVSLRAKLAMPEPKAFGEADLTLRIGDVRQRIRADAIRPTSRGFRYRDPEGANGFFRLVDFDAKRKRLRAVGRSDEAEAPIGTNRVVSLESSELYVASSGE